MASMARGSARTRRDESLIFLMGARLAVMRVSPWAVRTFLDLAARSEMGRLALACSSVRRMTSSLRPRSNVERPVPPPRATTRKPGERVFDLEGLFFMLTFGMTAGFILQRRI